MARLRKPLFVLTTAFAAAVAASSSCTSSDSTTDTTVLTTAVLVDPADFLGSLPCSEDIEGAAQSYAATVVDIGSGFGGGTAEDSCTREHLGSDCNTGGDCCSDTCIAGICVNVIGDSARTGCSTPLAFTNVTVGDTYAAFIEVFDSPVGESVGAPTWTTTCGLFGEGAVARDVEEVPVRGCDPLQRDPALPLTTAISIDTTAAAATLKCAGEEGGVVDKIDIIPVEPADTTIPQVTRACGQDALILQGTAIIPGITYTFRLDAHDIAVEQEWGAICTATARKGLTIHADCTQLSDRGTLVFPVVDLADEAGLECGTDVTRAKVAILAGPDTLDPTAVGCNGDITVDVQKGSYVGRVELFDGADSKAAFSCTASVDPASVTEFVCTPD